MTTGNPAAEQPERDLVGLKYVWRKRTFHLSDSSKFDSTNYLSFHHVVTLPEETCDSLTWDYHFERDGLKRIFFDLDQMLYGITVKYGESEEDIEEFFRTHFKKYAPRYWLLPKFDLAHICITKLKVDGPVRRRLSCNRLLADELLLDTVFVKDTCNTKLLIETHLKLDPNWLSEIITSHWNSHMFRNATYERRLKLQFLS
jgi:hypothetical protein